jgi:hypothetical protein
MISAHDDSRYYLERKIIGLCIAHPMAFADFSNILSEKNFRNWEHKGVDHTLMWRILNSMFPTQTIDLVSVSHVAKQVHKVDKEFLYNLMKYHDLRHDTAHLWTHAFLLLEFDLQSKFLEELLRVGSIIHPTKNLVAKAAVEECVNLLNEKMVEDTLEDLPSLLEYLSNHAVPEEHLEHLKHLCDSLDLKVKAIKKQKTIDTILTALLSYGDFQPAAETKAALNQLTEMISIIYLTKKATPDFVNNLQNLKQQLLQA